MISYSQNGEDLIISEYFGDFKGLLLDIGANDGVTFSNSHKLIESGWAATLVEPSLAYYKLIELYPETEYTGIIIEHIAISKEEGFSTWYELEDSLLCTVNKEIADSWGRNYKTTSVPTYPYWKVSDPYDFITIDAEGEDWNILQQIDLSYTKCLCIEYGKYETEITDYCKMFHMKQLHRNGENLIFAI